MKPDIKLIARDILARGGFAERVFHIPAEDLKKSPKAKCPFHAGMTAYDAPSRKNVEYGTVQYEQSVIDATHDSVAKAIQIFMDDGVISRFIHHDLETTYRDQYHDMVERGTFRDVMRMKNYSTDKITGDDSTISDDDSAKSLLLSGDEAGRIASIVNARPELFYSLILIHGTLNTYLRGIRYEFLQPENAVTREKIDSVFRNLLRPLRDESDFAYAMMQPFYLAYSRNHPNDLEPFTEKDIADGVKIAIKYLFRDKVELDKYSTPPGVKTEVREYKCPAAAFLMRVMIGRLQCDNPAPGLLKISWKITQAEPVIAHEAPAAAVCPASSGCPFHHGAVKMA